MKTGGASSWLMKWTKNPGAAGRSEGRCWAGMKNGDRAGVQNQKQQENVSTILHPLTPPSLPGILRDVSQEDTRRQVQPTKCRRNHAKCHQWLSLGEGLCFLLWMSSLLIYTFNFNTGIPCDIFLQVKLKNNNKTLPTGLPQTLCAQCEPTSMAPDSFPLWTKESPEPWEPNSPLKPAQDT